MAGIVEDRHVRILERRRRRRHLVVALQREFGATLAILLDVRIQAVLTHDLQAVRAAAFRLGDDVQEDAVAVREEMDGLLDLLAEIVRVGRVEADAMETSLQRTCNRSVKTS